MSNSFRDPSGIDRREAVRQETRLLFLLLTVMLIVLAGSAWWFFRPDRQIVDQPAAPAFPEMETASETTPQVAPRDLPVDNATRAARDYLKTLAHDSGAAGDKLYNFLLSGKLRYQREVYEIKHKGFRSDDPATATAFLEELAYLAAVLQAYPTVELTIAGHTSESGAPAAERATTQAWADRVRQELIDLGVAADRLTARGFGSRSPIAEQTTPEGRAMNERVEILIRGM